MTFKEKKEIENETALLCVEVSKLLEENKIAKDIWLLCSISDNYAVTSEKLENSEIKEKEVKDKYEEDLLIQRKDFYEYFIYTLKNIRKMK